MTSTGGISLIGAAGLAFLRTVLYGRPQGSASKVRRSSLQARCLAARIAARRSRRATLNSVHNSIMVLGETFPRHLHSRRLALTHRARMLAISGLHQYNGWIIRLILGERGIASSQMSLKISLILSANCSAFKWADTGAHMAASAPASNLLMSKDRLSVPRTIEAGVSQSAHALVPRMRRYLGQSESACDPKTLLRS